MTKAVQEIIAALRKADMDGAHVDAGHIADQIELAFAELEDKWLHTPGNAAAMREALMKCEELFSHTFNSYKDEVDCTVLLLEAKKKVRLALSAPARNCDLRYYNNATIDECSARAFVDHLRYCEMYGACGKCPIYSENGSCLAKFLLSPAEGVSK